jgi:hypothetical protein
LFQLLLPDELIKIVELYPDSIIYNGSKTLTQFIVTDSKFSQSFDGSILSVDIKLSRRIAYHLTNTYLPTITLLIIAEVTLMFDESKTELSVGLSLTIMLVMYTMYQSINDSVMKTAYLKMIDYWIMFSLLIPFIIFMIEVFWLINNCQNYIKPSKGYTGAKQAKNGSRKMVLFLTYSFSCFFIIVYSFVAFLMFFEKF